MSIQLSVIVITKNESDCIARCLQSVEFADEIIVLDSGSTDNTVAIARDLGAIVYETDWPGFGKQKQRALNYATGDWVLSLDADEYLDNKAKDVILKGIQNKFVDAFYFSRCLVFNGKILKYAGFEKKKLRLFKRTNFSFDLKPIHENLVLLKESKKAYLPVTIYHNCFLDWSDAIAKMNDYSSISLELFKDSPNVSVLRALIASFSMFIKKYILRGWFLDRSLGLCFAIYDAQQAWYRYLKRTR